MFFGGDYNPEQWPEEVWDADVELMCEAGVTAVTVGVFAWSHLEPSEGEYDFAWLDRVLDRLHDGGIKVVLATPTASPPPWFTLAHPEALPVNADGVRLTHGSRDTYCVSAPAYRLAARRIASELGRRYADHPALAMWHVHNEYGTDCRCDLTAAAFREWLRARHSSLDALNEAWTTAFWSQRYSDWAQIMPPRATQYLPNPAQVLDFRRFLSDEMLSAFVEQRDLLRGLNPSTPITTNFVQGGWVSVDHARWAGEVDVVAVDHYPDLSDISAEEQTAFAGDLARSWGRGSWLLMETAPNLIFTRGRMHTKEPGRLARQSLSYVARGSDGAMYFQWRQPRGGAEVFHSALVPHAGPDSPIFREVVDLGTRLGALSSQLEPTEIPAEVAVTWDAPSWWALQGAGLPSAGIDYLAAVQQTHRALFRAGIPTDFVFPGTMIDLSAYRIVVVPHLYLVSDEVAAALRDFVASGGHLVVGPLSGVADPFARVGPGGYPAAFRHILGVRVTEWHPQDPGVPVHLDDGSTAFGWAERVELIGAQALARYTEGTLAGEPAVTRNGTAWYVSAGLDDAGWERMLRTIAAEANVPPVLEGLPPEVEAVRRGQLLFVFNHSESEASVKLPSAATDAVTGRFLGTEITIRSAEALVARLEKPVGTPTATSASSE
ncbi:beta-galactosidase [Actinoplanes sp. CA-015351]|uniref:beta-galactosidase n=1 Tax=Actinoplanes sp. CA-015351 TaxID=3239897 RepID=UPI003D962B93